MSHPTRSSSTAAALCRAFVCLLLIGAACTSRVDLEQVPLGTRVEVTRHDGGVVQGTLTARDDHDIRLTVGSAARSIPRDQIALVALVNGTAMPRLSAAAKFREYTLPAGTPLVVRLDSALGSDTSQVGDAVEARLTEAAVVDDVEVLPVGSLVNGVVTSADSSGKVSGRATLAVRFRSVSRVGDPEPVALSAGLGHTAESTKSGDAKRIGIPAAGGAIIGAIIGGKKGAGIGATIGGGAGAIVVLTSAGPEVRYPKGTVVSLPLDQAIEVRVPITR